MTAALIFLAVCIVAAAFIIVSVRAFQVNPALVKKIFRYMVIVAIAGGFSIASVAIGFRVSERNSSSVSKNFRSVAKIWGGEVVQPLPSFTTASYIKEQYLNDKTGQYGFRTRKIELQHGFRKHIVEIDIKSNIRKKGLLEFAGYNLSFKARYECVNTQKVQGNYTFSFTLPERAGSITDVSVKMNGSEYRGDKSFADGIDWTGSLGPGKAVIFEIDYRAQGTGSFRYGRHSNMNSNYATENTKINRIEVEDFTASLKTDFSEVDVLDGTMAPAEQVSDSSGNLLRWKASSIILDQDLGLNFVISSNYGEFFSRIFFYAPLVIFIFMAFIVIFASSKGIALHPVNHVFLLSGFFVFYLLGSYLASYMHIFGALILALSASTGISMYYARLTGKGRELVYITGVGMVIFQWFFSGAFFFPEHTGLLITVASIAALVFLMKMTAKTDWEGKL